MKIQISTTRPYYVRIYGPYANHVILPLVLGTKFMKLDSVITLFSYVDSMYMFDLMLFTICFVWFSCDILSIYYSVAPECFVSSTCLMRHNVYPSSLPLKLPYHWGWPYIYLMLHIVYIYWAATWDFQQCGILTSVDSDEAVQPPFKLRNSKRCLVGSLTVIEYSSD